MGSEVFMLNFLYDEKYQPENNGEISDSILQNWTPQALECYKNNCDCSKCSLDIKSYSFVCQMPKVVELLKKTAPLKQNVTLNLL